MNFTAAHEFVDLEQLQLVTGDTGVDQSTGEPTFIWLPDINSEMAEKLSKAEFRFQIELGATEKPDLPVLRKQVENIANILMGKGVLEAFQAQGWLIDIGELFKKFLSMFPDTFQDTSKIIRRIQQMQQQIPGQVPGQGGGPANQQLLNQPPVNNADIISAQAGEKGPSVPIA